MRPDILNNGYSLRTTVLFAVIAALSRQPIPDAARFAFYRPDFYGALSGRLTQEAMRGPSAWSIGDRELMAAYVSQVNECAFCIGAHSATASRAYQNPTKVAAVLADLETAPIQEGLRATLRLLVKVTRGTVCEDDVSAVLSAGVSGQQIRDALAVSLAFNVTDRLASAFAFEVLDPLAFEAGAKYLLARGYR